MTTIRCMALAVIVLFLALPARGDIARIDLNGAIDPITAEFVTRSIAQAENERAQLLLIRLQTPGGFRFPTGGSTDSGHERFPEVRA
jgi:membrane-bound serine protease (ClpP class)